jgi:NAD(P)H-hydrate epimerase
MEVLTVEGIRSLDEQAKAGDVEKGYALMRTAGKALFNAAKETLKSDDGAMPKNVAVALFIGGGNNGGDGLVCGEFLIQAGIPCTLYSLVAPEKFKGEAALAYKDFQKEGGRLVLMDTPEKASCLKSLDRYQLVIDCMLGTGGKGELREPYASIVRLINESKVPVLSADVPTGFTTIGESKLQAVRAMQTLMFGAPRLEAFTAQGLPYFGKAKVARLPYPEDLLKELSQGVYLMTEGDIPDLLPHRDECGEKRDQGCALIIAGSKDMPGAAALCTKACLRSGAGLVTLASPCSVMPVLQAKMSEPVFMSLEGATCFESQHVQKLLAYTNHVQAVAIGPGLSLNDETRKAVIEFTANCKVPMVIDADGLNALSEDGLRNIKTAAILTPHRREFARLFGELPQDTCDLRETCKLIKEKAKDFNKTILLKNSPILIATPDEKIFVVPAANSGLAKGGSGDVLTGIIAALLAQSCAPADAAVLGALLHQKAGEIAREKFGAFSMLPSDVIESLPQVFLQAYGS